MPASYRIDLHAGVVFTVFEGRVTNEELMDHQRRLSADPDVRPTMSHVMDVRGITEAAFTAFGVRCIAARRVFAPGSRSAIVARADSSHGYLTMFQALRGQSGEEIRIFSTAEDAHRWLGLEKHGSPEA
jgi:hypothetical protein